MTVDLRQYNYSVDLKHFRVAIEQAVLKCSGQKVDVIANNVIG